VTQSHKDLKSIAPLSQVYHLKMFMFSSLTFWQSKKCSIKIYYCPNFLWSKHIILWLHNMPNKETACTRWGCLLLRNAYLAEPGLQFVSHFSAIAGANHLLWAAFHCRIFTGGCSLCPVRTSYWIQVQYFIPIFMELTLKGGIVAWSRRGRPAPSPMSG